MARKAIPFGSRLHINRVIALLLWTAAATTPLSATDLETVRALLTGGSSKVWTLERTEIFLSAGATRCRKGEHWAFLSDGKIEVSRCVDGVFENRTASWKLEAGEDLDPALLVDGERYSLLLRTEPAAVAGDPDVEILILRQLARFKVDTTLDLEFRHQPE